MFRNFDGQDASQAAPYRATHVFKFDSALLREAEDFVQIASELYRWRRHGRAVVAMVPASGDATDAPFAEAAAIADGEEGAVALLRLACERIGLPAATGGVEAPDLETAGDRPGAAPVRLDTSPIRDGLETAGLVIIPDFVGVGEDDERHRRGRGGSDYMAVLVAEALGADAVRLYQKADGVFDTDRAGTPIEPDAVKHAARSGLPIEVTGLGSKDPARVGADSAPPRPGGAHTPLRIKLAGYGVVGQALAERLRHEERFEITAILVRDVGRARRIAPPCPLSTDCEAFLAEPADIVVDLLSSEATSSRICAEELAHGVHVVSASKQAISRNFTRLSEHARAGDARLLYSAAVGGSAPVLETVDLARGQGRIAEVAGILNGTVNFLLGRLADGCSYSQALAEAQTLGFAEADPEADVSGADVQAKLRLVAQRALDCPPGRLEVPAERLTPDRAEAIRASGERWVQLARLARRSDAIDADVRFVPLGQLTNLPAASGEWNCAAITLADGRVFRCTGRGAGGAATAEAVLADLFSLPGPRDAAAAPRPETIGC